MQSRFVLAWPSHGAAQSAPLRRAVARRHSTLPPRLLWNSYCGVQASATSTSSAAPIEAPENAATGAVPEAFVDADVEAEPIAVETEYTEVLVTTETETEEPGFQMHVALGQAQTFMTSTPAGKGILTTLLLVLLALGARAAKHAHEQSQTPQARRIAQIGRNKRIADELSKLLPGQRSQLSPSTIKSLCRSTGFTPVEVFRKFLWFVLRERRFDQEAVDDMVALKAAAELSDAHVAEALGDRAQRVYDEYGTLMLNTEGFTQEGLSRKAACKALCQKILYLAEHEPLVSKDSEAAELINLRTIFGATEEDMNALRLTSLEEIDLEAAFIKDTDEAEEMAYASGGEDAGGTPSSTSSPATGPGGSSPGTNKQ